VAHERLAEPDRLRLERHQLDVAVGDDLGHDRIFDPGLRIGLSAGQGPCQLIGQAATSGDDEEGPVAPHDPEDLGASDLAATDEDARRRERDGELVDQAEQQSRLATPARTK